MEWTQIKLPFPVYQQEAEEKCVTFLRRIEASLEPSNSNMLKEDATFWFLVGCREDVSTKIPFNPSVSQWIDPIELESQLEKIDSGESLCGPLRLNRLQDCFNYFICNKCGQWGHRVSMCRNEKCRGLKGVKWKRKLEDLRFNNDGDQPKSKNRHEDQSRDRSWRKPPPQHNNSFNA